MNNYVLLSRNTYRISQIMVSRNITGFTIDIIFSLLLQIEISMTVNMTMLSESTLIFNI
jgi:hypothetical protein